MTTWSPALLFAFRRSDRFDTNHGERSSSLKDNVIPAVPACGNPVVAIHGVSVSSLITAIRNGDRNALGTIYEAYLPALRRIAILRLDSAALAEEVVHDVFLAFWLRRETLDPSMDVKVYLATAVRNRARDHWSHETVVLSVEQRVQHATLHLPGMSQDNYKPETAVDAEDFYVAYRRALTVLTDREREAALLRWEEGFTLEQVARVLGLSVVGARAVILRAQKKVQTGLMDFRQK